MDFLKALYLEALRIFYFLIHSCIFQRLFSILKFHFCSILLISGKLFLTYNFRKFNKSLRVVLDAGPGAVNFILDHAEVDFVFVQDKKVKEVRT